MMIGQSGWSVSKQKHILGLPCLVSIGYSSITGNYIDLSTLTEPPRGVVGQGRGHVTGGGGQGQETDTEGQGK